MSLAAAHAVMSRFSIAAAIRSGKRSGVQAKAGTPTAASAAACSCVEARPPRVAEREQRDDRGAGGDDRRGPAQHLLGDAALVEVADEHEDRVAGLLDEPLAVGERPVDVGAAAELDAEEHVDGVVELVGEVDDGGVEDDEPACSTDRSEASTAPKTLE